MNAPARAPSVIVGLLRSLRAAVGVLAVLVAASAVGTLIPQGKPRMFYVTEYGFLGGHLAWYAGFSDLYHNAWFVALLAWLLTSMVVCSLSHLKHVLLRPAPRGPEELDAARNEVLRAAVSRPEGLTETEAAAALDRLAGWLRGRNYAVTGRATGSSALRLAAQRGGVGRFGAFIIHWGCVIVLAGGLLSAVFGKTQRFQLGENDTAAVSDTPYKIRLHDFSIERYPDSDKGRGLHKSYLSRISLLKGDATAADGEIRVNEPFVFAGYRFYQMEYRAAVRDLRVRLDRASDGAPIGEYPLRIGEQSHLPELGLKIKAEDFQPDFIFHKGEAGSRSEEFKNPAVKLRLASREGVSALQWVFPDVSGSFHGGKGLPYKARLASYEPRYAIGLKVVKDPGRPVIYLGYIIVIAGTFLSCAVFHRRLFVRLTRNGRGASIELVGATRRNRIGFEKELESLRRAARRALRPGDAA